MSEAAEPQQPAGDAPAPAEPASMDDTIRDTYTKLNSPEPEAPEAPATPEVEDPEAPAAEIRERDEKGRFKAKGAEGEETPVEATDEALEAEPEAADDESDTDAPASAWPEAPNSWTKDAAEEYANLPENVKAEIHRREGDFHKGLDQYKGMAQIGQVLDKEIQPYAELIRQKNTTAPAVIRDLLGTQKTLVTGSADEKAAVAASILLDYGVDLEAVNRYLENPQARPSPEISNLTQQVTDLQSQLNDARIAPLQAQVDAFADDPANEFFTDVADDMIALLGQGRAKDLKDAYDKAVWANPETRAKLMAKQQEAARRSDAEKAASAKKAGSANVPRRGTPPAAPVTGTMEDTIRATYRKVHG